MSNCRNTRHRYPAPFTHLCASVNPIPIAGKACCCDSKSDVALSVPPSETSHNETARSAGSETARSQTYRSDGGSDTYHTGTYRALSRPQLLRIEARAIAQAVLERDYHDGNDTYRTHDNETNGSDTYHEDDGETHLESDGRAETPRPKTYIGTGSGTCRTGSGSEGGTGGF
ncbi:hypothetical protein FRC11_010586, partial [Ceratobasidium sp. 423]